MDLHMSHLNRHTPAILMALVWSLSATPAWSDEEGISYNRDVRPILSDKCFACHGFDAASREADLRLDTREGAIADLGGYQAIVPGNPDASEAMVRMLESDESMRMPPPHSHKELTAAELDLLKRWIAAGAEYEEHWSYRPLKRPRVPEGEASEPAEKSHPVDAFIRRQLKAKGLTPSPEADKQTLVRRLYVDLLGIPPRPDEVAAFLDDSSPDAWEKLVDRLLDDPRFGERMAVMWLDLVRYADTIGYHSDNHMEVSAYRDYVIESFNRNKPFDRFTLEQLAGDLLPNATRETRVASGYNMLLQTTEEGGAQPKEYVAIYAADRVRNVSEVWLGSTMGCAQCHDHKYDPFTMRDFYTMSAFFADIDEQPIGPRASKMALPNASQERRMQRLLDEIDELRGLNPDSDLGKQVAAGQSKWEAAAREQLEAGHFVWTAPELLRYEANDGIGLKRLPDSSVLSSGPTPYSAVYEVELSASGTIRSLRLETLTDPSFLRTDWLSREYGGFVLTDIQVLVDDKPIEIVSAQADYEQGGFPIRFAYDDNQKTGWAVAGRPAMDRLSARFDFAQPIALGDTPKRVRVVLKHESIYSQHHIGKFRIGVSDQADAPLDAPNALPVEVARALKTLEGERTASQREQLSAYYQTISPELEGQRAEVRKLYERYHRIAKRLQTTLVAQALPEPRMTRVLARGNWQDDTGEIVQPAVPEFLPQDKLPTDRRLTRLDLAEWIVDESNPLPPRTLANRFWKMLHGRGISVNLGDLGGQGEPPTHPDLLDWLAVELRESGWDIKHLIRLLVTSQTYRQTSYASQELRERDPGNRWLARQGRWRMEAEFVRDTALQVAGLLKTDRIGGLSVKPYQPKGYWRNLNFPPREWQNSTGDDLYRRSLYTYWCRTFLHPSMVAFDAPSREECTAERARSNVPQQALVLLNDPIYVEAARAFAERILQQKGSVRERLKWAYREAVSRVPHDQELAILEELYHDQYERYAAAPEDAPQLIGVGESTVAEGLSPVELAAWTQVTRALFSAYETTSRF